MGMHRHSRRRREYTELKHIARRQMAGEWIEHTLQASVLVNEAYIRLVDWKSVDWKNCCPFSAMGTRMMRRFGRPCSSARFGKGRCGCQTRATLNTAVPGVQRQAVIGCAR